MFPFSHAFSGFLVALVLSLTGLTDLNSLTVTLSVAVSLLPDADILWSNELIDHHKSIIHTPVFWLSTSVLIYTAGFPGPALVTVTAAGFHLLSDYITGRTIGVPFLYPFSSTQFSLYNLNPETANFNPLRPEKEKLKKHLSAYLENKKQLIYELGVNLAGFLSLLAIINLI